MCFNDKTSIGAFSTGLSCLIFLLYRGFKYSNPVDILSGLLLILIITIQIIEYILWKNQDCNEKNKIASWFIIIVLYLQPIIYYMFRYILYGNKISKLHFIFNFIFIIIGVALFTSFFLLYIYPKKDLCSKENKETGRIEWEPLKILSTKTVWLILFLIFYLGSANLPFNNALLNKTNLFRRYFVHLMLLIAIIYSAIKTGKNIFSAMGSLWCFLAVFYGIVCIALPTNKKYF